VARAKSRKPAFPGVAVTFVPRWSTRNDVNEHAPTELLQDLTARELEVTAAAHSGRSTVCGDLSPGELAATTDPDHLIRAELLREIVVGHHGTIDPRGVRVQRARVTGTLDLD
jgi:hypothetical protein